jgi:hypothetical protein
MLEKRQKIRVDREKVYPPSQKNNDFLDNIFIVDLYITQKLHTSRHFFTFSTQKTQTRHGPRHGLITSVSVTYSVFY